MARRKKNNLADAVVEATALLPWWAGVALVVLSYLLLHSMVQKPLTVVLHPLDMVFVAIDQLGEYAASLPGQRQAIADALDELLTRSWG